MPIFLWYTTEQSAIENEQKITDNYNSMEGMYPIVKYANIRQTLPNVDINGTSINYGFVKPTSPSARLDEVLEGVTYDAEAEYNEAYFPQEEI